jgi:hypothetical protein
MTGVFEDYEKEREGLLRLRVENSHMKEAFDEG